MRLTPSWFRSSSETSDEESADDPETAGVTIYHTSGSALSKRSDDAERAAEFLPQSDAKLLAEVDELRTPVTVDEITDQLVEPARPSIDTWAAVHERLHQERLPALDTAGDIEFDEAQGVVERSAGSVDGRGLFSLTALGAVSIAVLFVLLAIVSTSVLTAVLVTLVTTSAAVWFIPG